MRVEDLREVEPSALFETDIAVVGSGPAGLSLARQFAATSVSVLILESGGFDETPDMVALNGVESTGAPRQMDPREVRNRVFGGTSHTWTGRCRTFDDIDFEVRNWVPYSGWPIRNSDIQTYVERAGAIMRLGPNVYDARLWDHLGRVAPGCEVNGAPLHSCFWQYSRSPDRSMEFMRFGPDFLKLDAPNIRAFTHATVTHIDAGTSGRKLRSLEVTPVPGKTVTVIPRVAVLCAGGIENARLLLASNRSNPKGLGNDNDLVGRFLMDHPRTTLGEFPAAAARAVQSRFGLLQLRTNGTAHFYTHGLALSPELQRREELLNCAVFLSEQRAADDPWDALKRLLARRSVHPLQDAIAVAAAPGLLLDGARRRWIGGGSVVHKLDKLTIDCLVEQVPDPDSRLTLSEKRDAFDMPVARVHWKISEQERRSVLRLAQLFACEMGRVGVEPPKLADWVRDNRPDLATFRDVAHPTGTTRMADDATQGVVDRHCQVHGVEGIYVAGSSVFPTAGHANPTLMIVALALRLADRLKHTYFACVVGLAEAIRLWIEEPAVVASLLVE